MHPTVWFCWDCRVKRVAVLWARPFHHVELRFPSCRDRVNDCTHKNRTSVSVVKLCRWLAACQTCMKFHQSRVETTCERDVRIVNWTNFSKEPEWGPLVYYTHWQLRNLPRSKETKAIVHEEQVATLRCVKTPFDFLLLPKSDCESEQTVTLLWYYVQTPCDKVWMLRVCTSRVYALLGVS